MLAAMNPNPKLFERVNPIELNGGQGAERLADAVRHHAGRHGPLGAAQPSARDRGARAPARGDRSRRRPRRRGPPGPGRPTIRARAPTRRYEKIAALLPVYRADGQITAATSSGQADGAAVCLLMSTRRGRAPRSRAAGADSHHRRRGLRADRPDPLRDPRHRARLRALRPRAGRHGGDRGQRGLRVGADRPHAGVRDRRTTAASTRTAAPARSAIPSARRARASSEPPRWSSAGVAAATGSPPSAAAWARARRRSSKPCSGGPGGVLRRRRHPAGAPPLPSGSRRGPRAAAHPRRRDARAVGARRGALGLRRRTRRRAAGRDRPALRRRLGRGRAFHAGHRRRPRRPPGGALRSA